MCKVALCFLESAAALFFLINSAARCYSFVDTSTKVFAHVDEQFRSDLRCASVRARLYSTIQKKKKGNNY